MTSTDDWGDDVVTITVHTSSRYRHTTTACPPRMTWWSKRDAAPQSDDEFDFTSFGTEIEEPEEVDILEMEETDARNGTPFRKPNSLSRSTAITRLRHLIKSLTSQPGLHRGQPTAAHLGHMEAGTRS